jgi:hypothetical protein
MKAMLKVLGLDLGMQVQRYHKALGGNICFLFLVFKREDGEASSGRFTAAAGRLWLSAACKKPLPTPPWEWCNSRHVFSIQGSC